MEFWQSRRLILLNFFSFFVFLLLKWRGWQYIWWGLYWGKYDIRTPLFFQKDFYNYFLYYNIPHHSFPVLFLLWTITLLLNHLSGLFELSWPWSIDFLIYSYHLNDFLVVLFFSRTFPLFFPQKYFWTLFYIESRKLISIIYLSFNCDNQSVH